MYMYIHIHIHIYIYVNIHIYLHIYIFVVNVILARQTCGQRSSKAAESKRRALGKYFFERIRYMIRISKCRRDWDLGHNFGTCVWITAAQWRLPGGKRVPTQGKLDFATALRMKRRIKKRTSEKTPWFGSFLLWAKHCVSQICLSQIVYKFSPIQKY